MKNLYIVAYVNDDGEVEGFPQGGGSSSPAYIRAWTSLSSARRSAKYFNAQVIKLTDYDVVLDGFEVVE